jgi:hypothetical protein
MQLDWRQLQVRRDVRVFHGQAVINFLSFNHFRSQRAADTPQDTGATSNANESARPRHLDAIAEPQPNVLNLASVTTPSLSTRIWHQRRKRSENDTGKRATQHPANDPAVTCNFMTSPHAGAPTNPVPTSGASFGNDPVQNQGGKRKL